MVKVLKEKSISLPEVKELLASKKSLSNIEQITLDYASKFSKASYEEAKNILKTLTKNFKINETTAIQIINMMPKTKEELKTILASEKTFFSEEILEKILKILA